METAHNSVGLVCTTRFAYIFFIYLGINFMKKKLPTIVFSSRSGFSMVETVVALGVGALMIAGSLKFIDNLKSTKVQQRDRDEVRLEEFTHKFYGRKFLELAQEIGLSALYFKIPIEFKADGGRSGNTNVCAKASGGCFFRIGKTREMTAIPTRTLNFPKKSKKRFINLLKDEGGGIIFNRGTDGKLDYGESFKSRKLKACCRISTLQPIRYDSDVKTSKEHRYFVGWTFKEDSPPLFFMGHDQDTDKYFELDNYQGLAFDDLDNYQELKENFAGKGQEKLSHNAIVLLPKKIHKHLTEKDIKKYKNKFYIFYHSGTPEFYFIAYAKNIQKCVVHGDEVIDLCKRIYAAVDPNYTPGDDRSYNMSSARESAGDKIKEIEAPPRNQGVYVMSFKFVKKIVGSPFHNGYWNKRETSDMGLLNLSSYRFWPGHKEDDPPFAPYRAPSISLKDNVSDLFQGSINKNWPLGVHFVIDLLSMNDRLGEAWSLMRPIRVLPVKFYKLSLESGEFKITELKNGVTRSNVTKLDGKSQTFMRLPTGSSVVLARQLGTQRLSTFVRSPSKKK